MTITDRRLKAQLETDEPSLHKIALTGLQSLTYPAILAKDRGFLYNRSALFAQASKLDAPAGNKQRALRWLGLATICNPTLGNYSLQDPVLAPIHKDVLQFLTCLRSLIPEDNYQNGESSAESLVAKAIEQISTNSA